MKLKLINQEDSKYAQSVLDQYYQDQFIAAEKKNYLTDLKNSFGPYLGVQTKDGETHYLMDAASQIATLGLGFNPSSYYGLMHHTFAYTGNKNDKDLQSLKQAFDSFLKRTLKWNKLTLTFCHSGAEAVETALGDCFQNRVNKKATKILAFEDSFHGRMLVSLSSTWNPIKRAPFEWDGYKTNFEKIPAAVDGDFKKILPKAWINYWSNCCLKNNADNNDNDFVKSLDSNFTEEYHALKNIQKKLETNHYFAIIIEPMQCEGGDRYLTNSFINALLLMAQNYNIPFIMDEVQTGFHLGSKFFWHQEFTLKDQYNNLLEPDYIICAKKAQVGIVISHQEIKFKNLPKRNEFSNASLLRGYIQANLLQEKSIDIKKINSCVNELLNILITDYSDYIKNPRSNGLAFSFDFSNSDHVSHFVKERFNYGLLFYPAGSNTLRFRLTTAFKENDLEFLFHQLNALSSLIFKDTKLKQITEIKRPYHKYLIERKWQDLIIETKLEDHHNDESTQENKWNKTKSKIVTLLQEDYNGISLEEITAENFSKYRDEIIVLEENTYEKTRQTDISKFELAAKQTPSFCFALINSDSKQIIGICFSGLLSIFPYEKGIKRDPDFKNNNTLYMLDTTISNELQGKSLGKILKYIHLLKANIFNIKNVAGRNRCFYAKEMLSINFSLGAIEQFNLKEDYLDDLEFRDAIYYKYPVTLQSHTIDLSSKISNYDKFNAYDCLGGLLNKVCLSNFVSNQFLDDLKSQTNRVITDLHHVFSASGQSECVDKIIKSLWVNSNQESHLICSFKNHYFGQGSFLSRSISSDSNSNSNNDDHFFPVKHFTHPTKNNESEILKEIELFLEQQKVLAFFVEPMPTFLQKRVPQSFLIGLKEILSKFKVQLIYNETSSSLYRYSKDFDMLSSDKELSPDGCFNYLGGQAAIICLKKKLHYDKPLMMISTWDGDEYSFHAATRTYLNIKENLETYQKDVLFFDQKLTKIFSSIENSTFQIQSAAGFYQGPLPLEIKKMLVFYNDRYLISPSYDDILEFLEIE